MEYFDYDDEIEEDDCPALKSANHKINMRFKTRDKKRCEASYWQTYSVDGNRYEKLYSRVYKQFCKKRSNQIVRKFNGDIAMCGSSYKKLYDLWENF